MATPGSPSVQRLNHAREFDRVFKDAKYRASSAEFLVLASPNDRPVSRIGMVVSKKVAGTSVNRNRIRRVIRESFRLGFAVKGQDVVVVARPPSRKTENAKMHETLSNLWQRLSVTSMQEV